MNDIGVLQHFVLFAFSLSPERAKLVNEYVCVKLQPTANPFDWPQIHHWSIMNIFNIVYQNFFGFPFILPVLVLPVL